MPSQNDRIEVIVRNRSWKPCQIENKTRSSIKESTCRTKMRRGIWGKSRKLGYLTFVFYIVTFLFVAGVTVSCNVSSKRTDDIRTKKVIICMEGTSGPLLGLNNLYNDAKSFLIKTEKPK